MKYAFIVNPASGQGRHGNGLIPRIEKLIENNPGRDIEIVYTRCEKDATVQAERLAREAAGDVVVFACGGDGTVQEVVNGIYGYDNAILGIIPVGSGNDFVRALGGGLKQGKKFNDMQAQLTAPIKRVDLIKMTWMENGEEKSHICDNGINIGFDGNTCISAHEFKKLPLVSGTGAYIVGVAVNLIEKNGENLTITADGKEVFNGPMLLATVGNGGFCGGGFESCPRADLSDGLLELLIVNDMTRRKFITLVPKYKAGKIFDIKNPGNKVFTYCQAKEIVIKPNAAPSMKFVADGEIFETGEIKLEVLEQAMRVLYL